MTADRIARLALAVTLALSVGSAAAVAQDGRASAPSADSVIDEAPPDTPPAATAPTAATAGASDASAASPALKAGPAPDASSLPADTAVLVTEEGHARITVEIADDPIERRAGLMFRTDLPRDHGMLFDFGVEGPRSFWMKNTPLSLDLIFARADGTIVSIAKGAVPFSTDAIPSEGPARFVLEVNAGVADALGIAARDRLLHRRVDTSPQDTR